MSPLTAGLLRKAKNGGATFPNDPGPLGSGLAGWTTLADNNASTLGGWTDLDGNYGGTAFKTVTDATATISPSNVWQFFYASGDTNICGSAPGGAELTFAGQSLLYFGANIKFSSSFSYPGDTGGLNNNPGGEIHILYGNPTQTNSWVTIDAREDGGIEVLAAGAVDVYSDNAALYTRGSWTTWELLMDQANQRFRIWIGGNVILLNGGQTWITYNAPTAFVDVEMTPTWGGCGGDSPDFDSYIWVDHLRVSGHT